MKPGVANKVYCHFKTGFQERLNAIIDPQNQMGVMEKARLPCEELKPIGLHNVRAGVSLDESGPDCENSYCRDK